MGTVTVHCAVQAGLMMVIRDGVQFKRLRMGANSGVPADFWTRWYAENHDSSLVRLHRIRAMPEPIRADAVPAPAPGPAREPAPALRHAFTVPVPATTEPSASSSAMDEPSEG